MFKHLENRVRSRLHETRLKRREELAQKTSATSTVVERLSGEQPHRKNTRLCLMAHYDMQGRIDPYVLHYLDELNRNGFDVVLVSTSGSIDERDVPALRSRCRLVLRRENVGLDFGSWKAAMDLLPDFNAYSELLLTNDSVFGPIYPLAEALGKIASFSEVVTGLTDTWEKQYHLQSYFLHFKEPALRSATFKHFWDSFRLSHDKESIIINYEVGLSQAFIRDDFKLRPVFPFHELRDHCLSLEDGFQYAELIAKQPANPTIFMWDVLIRDFRFPFLKTEILKINRKDSKNVVHWRKMLPPSSESIIELISSFLKRGHWNCKG